MRRPFAARVGGGAGRAVVSVVCMAGGGWIARPRADRPDEANKKPLRWLAPEGQILGKESEPSRRAGNGGHNGDNGHGNVDGARDEGCVSGLHADAGREAGRGRVVKPGFPVAWALGP